MGAGNNEHSNGANNRVIWMPQKCPNNSGDQSRSERKPEQQRGSSVSDPLGAGGGVLCLRNEAVDSCQCCVIADGGDLYTQARIRGDGAGGDRIPAFADNRSGLASDHGLVHFSTACDDHAVCGNTPARADYDNVPDTQFIRDHLDDILALNPLSFIGE